MRKTTILIADDHALMRMGLKAMLSSQRDMTVVAEAGNGTKAVELARSLSPDVIIMDLMMPETSGAEATRLILKDNPAARVIILTSYGASSDMALALSFGAVGAQLKESPAEDLIQTIRTVMSGKTAISSEVQRVLADEPTPPQLTDRQSDILHAIVGGLTNKDIASKFNLSEGGVKKHLSLIFSKLGVTSRSEAVAIALRKHLLKI